MKVHAVCDQAGSEQTLSLDEWGTAVVVSPKKAESTIGCDEDPEAMIVGIGTGLGISLGLAADGLSPMSASAERATVSCCFLPPTAGDVTG